MVDLNDLDKIVSYLKSNNVPFIVNVNVPTDGGAIVPEPVPVPQPVKTVLATVTEDKAVLRCVSDYNKKGFPIMEIYEGPNGRVRFNHGESFMVYPDLVKADGGGEYYLVFDAENKYEAILYVRAGDVSIA
jgi:hypothetical protein